jgi:hypothetical protein
MKVPVHAFKFFLGNIADVTFESAVSCTRKLKVDVIYSLCLGLSLSPLPDSSVMTLSVFIYDCVNGFSIWNVQKFKLEHARLRFLHNQFFDKYVHEHFLSPLSLPTRHSCNLHSRDGHSLIINTQGKGNVPVLI